MDPIIYSAAYMLDGSDTTSAYPAIWAALFLLVILPLITRRRDETAISKIINRRKNKEERAKMNELAKSLIEKECIIYLFNGNQYTGVIKEVGEGAVLLDNKGYTEIINLDFVARIREYPKNKKGNKKSVVLD